MSSPAGGDAESTARREAHMKQLAEMRVKHPNVLFFIARSKNKNIVVYEGMLNAAGNGFNTDKACDVYWLDIDPEYQAAARKKGKMDDRVELGTIEKKFAYGVTPELDSSKKNTYNLKLVALPERTAIMFLDESGKLRAQMQVNGKYVDVVSVYVNAVDRTLQLPKVMYVDIAGNDPATGEPVFERILYNK